MTAALTSTSSDLGIADFVMSYLGKMNYPIGNHNYEPPRPVFLVTLFPSSSTATTFRANRDEDAIVLKFVREISEKSHDLDPKAYEYISDHFWELL